MIIFEILPFLVLAVGVDNIFIMVDAHQKTPKLENEEDVDHIGRVIGEVTPSMFVSTAAQVFKYLFFNLVICSKHVKFQIFPQFITSKKNFDTK